jgi:rod shape-determining protein MreC
VRLLFAYILKHYFFFLFLLLEIFAFFFIVQNNYQRATFQNSTGQVTGTVFNTFNNITEYFTLKKANKQLVDENADLHKSMKYSFRITDTLVYYEYDSSYQFISAKVISNTVNKQKNYLMLNKGRAHGIEKDMGVITSEGIVGTVVDVSENFARVMSILHQSNRINARIKKNNHLGNVEWDGEYYRKGLLTDIPTHVNLYKGDTIITSGNSYIFPEGILVGTVDEYLTDEGEKFNRAKLNFSVDFNNLYFVYVIVNMLKDEQLMLENQTTTDEE